MNTFLFQICCFESTLSHDSQTRSQSIQRKESITEGDGQQKGFPPIMDLTVQSTQYYLQIFPLPNKWQMSTWEVDCYFSHQVDSLPPSLSLPLSTLFLSITVTISVCRTCFWRISGTALYLENKAARKRHGIEQKLYPRASTRYKRLHSDNRNIEPQVTENTYCWLHNVWRMRHPWSTLDLCIKQHLLAQSNHRENSVLAFSGVTLGHKKVESIWLSAQN